MRRKTRRRSRKNKNRSKSIKSIIRSSVDKLASPVAFWTQLTSKDYQILNADPNYRAMDYTNKLKVASNILTGSLTGHVLFGDHYNPSPSGQPRINPAGVINQIVGIGIAGKIYGAVGKSMKLPEARSINKVANKVIYGGIVGGFFDPPSARSTSVVTTAHLSPVATQNRAVTRRGAMQYDLSTQGAFR